MKTRYGHISCWALILILFSYQTSLAFNTEPTQKAVKRKRTLLTKDMDSITLQKNVKAFLNIWLINRQMKEAKKFFSQQAYANKAMFSESCAGYISDSDRDSKEAIRRGVERFLADIQGVPKNKTLRKVLDHKKVSEMATQLKGKILNNIDADHFLLINIGNHELDGLIDKPESTAFLKEFLRNKVIYLSLIPRGQGLVIFLWGKEKQSWKIFHASLICM